MTRILIVAASLGLGLSTAGACEYLRMAKAKVDQTVVASVATEQQAMSTPVILPDEKAAAETEEAAE